MSTPKGFGLTRELENKKRSEYDPELAKKVCTWFTAVCESGGQGNYCVDFGGDYSWENVHKFLKDGKLLLAAALVVQPDKKKKVSTMNAPFKQRENITMFLDIAGAIGVSSTDLFQTDALYESKNMKQVVIGMEAFARKTIKMNNPALPAYEGPVESEQNKRDFTQEQLAAGQNVIGLQMGSNQGASAAGVMIGGRRHIMDMH